MCSNSIERPPTRIKPMERRSDRRRSVGPLSIQERHFKDVKQCSLKLASDEDPYE